MIRSLQMKEITNSIGRLSLCISYLPTQDQIMKSLEYKLNGGGVNQSNDKQFFQGTNHPSKDKNPQQESLKNALAVSQYISSQNQQQARNRFYSD
jgi:hypothetical protein